MKQATLRPLPILTPTGELPTGEALLRLREAKKASGYLGMVLPRQAVQGSPAPILAVGIEPGWLVPFALVPDFNDVTRLTAALKAVLIDNEDPRLGGDEYLLSKWFKSPVKYIGEEPYEPPVQL